MVEAIVVGGLWLGVLSAGAMAGLYYAFSAFIMRALAETPGAGGIAAMQAINRVIQQSSFLPLFFGSTLLSSGLCVAGLIGYGAPGGWAMALGGGLYVVGMFVGTVARNVPLNDRLDAVAADAPEAAAVWAEYRRDWTRWNTVRTIACLGSALLYLAALAQQPGG